MSDLTPRDHALKVAVLEALEWVVAQQYAQARGEAEPVFAAVRADGAAQQEVLLPDGTRIGLVSIKAGATDTVTDEEALLAWVQEHAPESAEEYIEPWAVDSLEVIAAVKAACPGVVKTRIRASARKKYREEIIKTGGWVTDPETGEKAEVAITDRRDPTGAFTLVGAGAQERRERIMAEWRAGRLGQIGLGPLALPAAEAAS